MIFYKFTALYEKQIRIAIQKKARLMKKVFRLLIALLVLAAVSGLTSSCSIFNESHVTKQASFKHQKPLPKKYIISNGYKPIAK
jgi:hypothetical protein